MAYDSTVPAAGSSLGNTRAPIEENFIQIEAAFNIDHVDLNAVGQGKHASVTMPEGAAVSTAASEAAMYTKDTNGRPTLFYRQESDGTEIQMTGPDPTKSTSGKTFLPGGMLMQWGRVSAASITGSTIFPTAFSALYSLTFGQNEASGTHYLATNATSFTWNKGRTTTQFYWTAIGAI